jgi:hypothetical protein
MAVVLLLMMGIIVIVVVKRSLKGIAWDSDSFLFQKLQSRVSLFQLKPVLDISLRGCSLCSCPRHSPKASPLAPCP